MPEPARPLITGSVVSTKNLGMRRVNLLRFRHLRLIPFVWAIPGWAEVLPEVRITEFLAVNDEGLRDEDGDRPDWIELWNASGVSGTLEGWYLTDDPEEPTKWRLPATAMEAGERLVVFASDKDRSVPGNELHTNFRLQSSAGGYLALVRPDGITVASAFAEYPAQDHDVSFGVSYSGEMTTTLLPEGAPARWLVPQREVDGWTLPGFDDAGWTAGATGIGYDTSGDYQAFFGAGGDLGAAMQNVNSSIFIRVPFQYSAGVGADDLVLRMRWEDGFAAFLNGVEITRQRAPEVLTWNATSEPAGGRNENDAITFFDYPVAAGGLRDGENVLAIHGLNQTIGSSDLLFSPKIEARKVDLSTGREVFFVEPSPGSRNDGPQFEGLVADTKFSVDRGTFDSPFDLEITTDTPGTSIRYTLDGTTPNEGTGNLYRGPISITGTTVVRAMAFRSGYRSTNVDTQTYLFPSDVIDQPEMRPQITEHPTWGPQMLDSLNALPVVSLSFDGNDVNRTELPVSVELLNFENGDRQIEAGAVRVGGFFTDYAKHSIRLHFRSRYGPKRFNYPVFANRFDEVPAVTSFDALDLRAGNQDMVHRGAYLSNLFADDSMLAMGQPAPRGRFVHLYFNGRYRGMYHLRERFHAAMISDYYPGSEDEYTTIDAVNRGNFFSSGVIQNGDGTDWNRILSGLRGGQPYREVRSRLNVENLIDFMLLWTSGSCESEFRAVGSPENGVPFVFHMKDADGFLRPPDLVDNDPLNRTFAYVHLVTHPGPADAMSRLRIEGDPDFETLLADRIHRHFFNDGALTPTRHIARLEQLVEVARLPYLAEVARWGRHDGTPNRDPAQWEAYQQDLLQNQFPILAAGQIAKLRAAGMYPDLEAPVFSQHGGSLPAGRGLVMSGTTSRIYYTLDGRDPRESGGAVSASALEAVWDPNQPGPEDFVSTGAFWRYLDDGSNPGRAWPESGFDDSGWSEGGSEFGYGEGDEETVVGFIDRDPAAPGIQRNATTYFRKEITIDNPGAFSSFTFSIKYDDGLAVYLNGEEIIRENLAEGATFETYAEGNSPDENAYFDFSIPVTAFVAGENTLAVEVHNASSFSGDLSFDLRLRGEAPGAGARLTDGISLIGPTVVKARGWDEESGEWSALTEAFFSLSSVPATSENLVISEIHYRPAEPILPAERDVSEDRDDFEFIELFNRSLAPVELGGVAFVDGITFVFREDAILEGGERLVLVRDEEAFRARYGEGIPIAGVYSGRLSNGGERLELARAGESLLSFIYQDEAPWPEAADGAGPSLFLVNPGENPSLGAGTSWKAHARVGGAPGEADYATDYEGWKYRNGVGSNDEDLDGDGLSALLEYAFGTSPRESDGDALGRPGFVEMSGVRFATMSFSENPEASGVSIEIQTSNDLKTWVSGEFERLGPGFYRSIEPVREQSLGGFYRIAVRLENP